MKKKWKNDRERKNNWARKNMRMLRKHEKIREFIKEHPTERRRKLMFSHDCNDWGCKTESDSNALPEEITK